MPRLFIRRAAAVTGAILGRECYLWSAVGARPAGLRIAVEVSSASTRPRVRLRCRCRAPELRPGRPLALGRRLQPGLPPADSRLRAVAAALDRSSSPQRTAWSY